MPENDITELQTLDIYQLTEDQYAELLESSEFNPDALYMTPASNVVTSVNGKTPNSSGNVDIVALPSGGTTGQSLVKQSATDGDAVWEDRMELVSSPTTDDILVTDEDGQAVDSGATINSLKCLYIQSASFSSLPLTINNSSITSNYMVVNSVLSNPSAQTSDWTVATRNGSLTISGSISGSTTITLYLMQITV